ncbi:DUF3224 domain-containing protein [Kribbella pratensis]|uniref:Uncharacterized protein DUF3224 n=1 Tax=Kribbella pratensis TaxID=2512112 RepID=A0A4R8C7E1_9ACTN|nr:DUF3224 domain-containing protein [Kribbella pratensis]TDW71161.1 uncharacterized protein DUF3224 [Kribbella pratensis]
MAGDQFVPAEWGKTVLKNQRLMFLFALVMSVLIALPVNAQAATNQLSGDAVYDAVQCPAPPTGYEEFVSYPGLDITGSLDGCWYTRVDSAHQTPSGAYLETGAEVFVGRLNGGPEGTFATTYKFEAKFEPDGAEIRGRCQHPIVAGSGTGGFAGATGRLDFKDIIGEPVTYVYRGHITLT